MTCSEKFYCAYPELENMITELGLDFIKVLSETPIETEELKRLVGDVDIYIVAVENVNSEVIDHAHNLKYILKHGVGTDNIDVKYAKGRGIVVTNAPGQNSDAVADMILALTLSLSRHLIQGDSIVKGRGWELLIGHELNNKVVGIVGLGSIGKRVAKRAHGFDMTLIAYDIIHDNDFAQSLEIRYVTKDQLLSKSDYVVICLDLNAATRNFFDKEAFKQMKSTAYLINTSRGPIVNEADLVWALNNEIIAGAALDVYSSEPPSESILSAKNIITTPHIAGSTYETAKKLSVVAVENIKRFLNGERLEHIVDR